MTNKEIILHINCNYYKNAVHKNLINGLDEVYENVVYSPTKSITNLNENIYIVKAFSKYDSFFFNIKQQKILRQFYLKVNIKDNIALIHGHTLFTDGNVAYTLAQKKAIPLVITVRSTDLTFLKYRPFLRRKGIKILNYASKIIFLSKSAKNSFFNNYCSKKYKEEFDNKSTVIPSGIDNFWIINRDKHEKDKNKIRVICASKINRNKNAISTCKALKKLQKDGYSVSFKLVGECVKKYILNKILKYDFVTYLPKLDKNELIFEYRCSDIFVMPSHRETFGLVYAEAMSQGLPVIYSKGQGFDGQFDDGLVGYAVKSKNYVELSNKVLDTYNNYNNLSNNSFRYCLNFDWKYLINEFLSSYKESIKGE